VIEEDITLIWETRPTARKRHHCDEHCGKWIEPGEKYIRQRNKEGSDVWTYRAHIECYESACVDFAH
jgi:hypothetical protein